MATTSQKQTKTTEQTTEQTPQETKTMNNQEQKTQTSTIHFSDYELRNEVLKNQALNDAYSDAKLYVQVYD
ncbi:MAG: hypothetical protein ACKPH7_29250, partial [Planktothrix sp.]|uniref:hypothetical protein n=1 Tax=Planktothrix sp. TaxID=3088171 RepID=UPI0038D4A509